MALLCFLMQSWFQLVLLEFSKKKNWLVKKNILTLIRHKRKSNLLVCLMDSHWLAFDMWIMIGLAWKSSTVYSMRLEQQSIQVCSISILRRLHSDSSGKESFILKIQNYRESYYRYTYMKGIPYIYVDVWCSDQIWNRNRRWAWNQNANRRFHDFW